jgi:seryl-tRNA synthetase
MDRLQGMVFDLQAERRELLERIERLESGKQRMERILKQNLAQKGKDPNSELVEELGVMMKRIEFLEQQSDERSKSAYLDHNLCNRKI